MESSGQETGEWLNCWLNETETFLFELELDRLGYELGDASFFHREFSRMLWSPSRRAGELARSLRSKLPTTQFPWMRITASGWIDTWNICQRNTTVCYSRSCPFHVVRWTIAHYGVLRTARRRPNAMQASEPMGTTARHSAVAYPRSGDRICTRLCSVGRVHATLSPTCCGTARCYGVDLGGFLPRLETWEWPAPKSGSGFPERKNNMGSGIYQLCSILF